jgi:putative ABC transport system permease protein
LLTESIVLASIGGTIGMTLAFLGIRALARFGPSDMPRLGMIAIDGQVLLYTVVATLFSALLFGLAPAFRLARAGLSEALKEAVRTVAGSTHQRTRRVLAAVEVALAFSLVVSSGLLLRSFVAMISANPGFQADGVLTASVELPTARYDAKASTDFYQRAAERVRLIPGVRDAAFSSDLPWTNYDENTSFAIVGRQFSQGEGPEARYHFITQGYTGASGTPLVAGRDLRSSDVEKAPLVMMLNEAAARKYWKTPEAAIGARVNHWGAERTVIGVIGDVRDMPWHDRAVPAMYFPQAQVWYPQPMFLIVKSKIDLVSIVDPIRRAMREIDPQLPLANVRPLETVASAAIATRRLTLWLVAIFGVTALVLAIVGIYGVIAQDVGQRKHEFGVRQALGATRADIMRLVLSSGTAITTLGLMGGVALAVSSTRLLVSLLYDVTPLDPVTFAAVGAVLLVAATAAAYLPARRATRVSAATALRAAD